MVVVKQHRAVTRVACRPSSAPDRCGHIGGRHPWRMLSCDRNAAGRWRRVLGSDGHRNCDALPCAGHWSERNPPHAQSQLCCRITAPAHANVTWCDCGTSALACAVRDGCGLRHAFRQRAANTSATGRWDCGCAVCNRWPMSLLRRCRTGRMERKKTVAAALAAPTVIDSPVRITWSRGGRTCSESPSAACRCRPCPAGR
ncbi:hypothetical protein FHT09_003359 [Xanthomonas arboricola]|nr:hypothetical protein [Xanthomonas sp. CFBP 8152]